MALKRPGSRFEASIWPGFVDAMTALLLILFFVIEVKCGEDLKNFLT